MPEDFCGSEAAKSRKHAWPVLDAEAFHGPLGEVVKAVAPETEADPSAILLTFLAAFGSAIPDPYVRISATDHHARLFTAIVGDTSSGAKGESWAVVESIMRRSDPAWHEHALVGGFASGEAVIASLADGTSGTRRFVVEPEFSVVLHRASRDGSILSPILRAAFDGSKLENRRAQTAVVAEDHHIGVGAHITPDELRRLLRSTEISNGFANRFLFGLTRRARSLPFGGSLPPERLDALASNVKVALRAARSLDRVTFADDATKPWSEFVTQTNQRHSPGIIGDLTARARPHALRLALIFAAADGSQELRAEHIRAALAIWRFSDASVRVIFETATGDPLADRVLLVIRNEPDGCSKSDLRKILGHNYPAADLQAASDLLVSLGVAERDKRKGSGRPADILRFTPPVKPAFTDDEWTPTMNLRKP